MHVTVSSSTDVGPVALKIGATGPQGPVGSQGITGGQGVTGAQKAWVLKTANYTAANNDRLVADTSNGVFTITLPASPNVGDYIIITDGAAWAANNLTVARNGSTIENANDDVLLNLSGITCEFIYTSNTWQVTATIGKSGAQGATGSSGSAGVQGASGTQGAAGDAGSQGPTGTGTQGTAGDAGPQGATGAGGGASLPLANGTSNVDIALANGYVTVTANTYTWTFNETNGLLELAGNLANFSACSAINFVANSSGDGAGYSTIELRPDSNASLDQYLIIDPTVPNHIHIRAGGTQDNSNAQIFLGGEYSYFSIGSGLNPSAYITANQRSWSFNNDGTITFPDSTTQNTAFVGTDIITVKKVFETTNALSSATGVVTHDCNSGHIFVHSSVSANFTANFTNTTIAANTATSFTLVINQGATPYVANAVQIGGVAQTVNWQGSTSAPGGNANKKDVMSFSVVNSGGTWIALGQLTSFG